MAIHAPITAAAECAPGNASTFAPSRRDLIRALPALAVLPAAAEAAPSSQWDAALAHYVSAHAAAKRYRAAEYDPAWERINASAGPAPSSRVEIGGAYPRQIDVDQRVTYPPIPLYDPARSAQKTWKEWFSRRCFNEQYHRAILNRQETLWEVEDAARKNLMGERAPHAAALAFKVQLAFDNDEIWEEDRAALLADARHLASAT